MAVFNYNSSFKLNFEVPLTIIKKCVIFGLGENTGWGETGSAVLKGY